MPGYIIADPDSSSGWTHIWNVQTRARGPIVEVERQCRFVLDRDRLRLVHVDVEIGGTMVRATSEETEDLRESLVNANPDVIDDPKSHGLQTTNRLPAWSKVRRDFAAHRRPK
jgi:hypothetical protein